MAENFSQLICLLCLTSCSCSSADRAVSCTSWAAVKSRLLLTTASVNGPILLSKPDKSTVLFFKFLIQFHLTFTNKRFWRICKNMPIFPKNCVFCLSVCLCVRYFVCMNSKRLV